MFIIPIILFKFATSNNKIINLNSGGNTINTGTRKMKKQAVIKSERSLNMVTNLYAKKVANSIGCFSWYQVKIEELIKGKINNIVVVPEKSHMLTKTVIDSVWEVVDELEKKYDSYCICGTIKTRPYLTKDGSTFLHYPVIEINVRVKED